MRTWQDGAGDALVHGPECGRRRPRPGRCRVRRLGVERLDLVQFHWWDYGVPGVIEAAQWLDELRRMAREFGVGDAPRAPAVEQLHKLQHQLAVLRPALPQYAAHQRDATPRGQRLGTVQTQRVESLLAHEAHLLAQARAKVQWMQHTLAPR